MPKFNPKIYDFRECTCIREWMKIMNQEQLILFKEILSCKEGSTQMIKLDNLMMDMKCNKEMQQGNAAKNPVGIKIGSHQIQRTDGRLWSQRIIFIRYK